MRVFVAGASAAIGTRLVPQPIERRKEVLGTHRSLARPRADPPRPARSGRGHGGGRRPRPDAAVHHATALADLSDFKHFDRPFHQTDLLRTRGTDALIAAAQAAGVARFVAQSYANARYARSGGMVTLTARQRA